jgi:hypothetical protein
MDSALETTLRLSPKPLGQLGRDEMNLAEFPIALLTDRVPKDQTEAIYQDEIFDDRTGRTLTRKLTIKAGSCGLTTAIDDEVVLALIQITKEKNGFTNRKVEFTRLELIKKLGWTYAGVNYERLATSLDRWTSVYLKYENAWRDNRTKTWETIGFHIIESFGLHDSRSSGEQIELIPSYVIWNEVIFDSFQAGYLKPLNYDLCISLKSSTAKRMYRFLDKRFHHRPEWLFDLKEFAHEHVGLGRHYEGPAHLKRNLQPAIAELEQIDFLEPLPEAQRFPKDGKAWKIRLIQKTAASVALPGNRPPRAADPEPSPLVAELTRRGVTAKSAEKLIHQHPAEFIQLKLDVFDWLWEKQDQRVAKSPAGYLVKSINDDYAAPKGFISKAERRKQQEAQQAKDRKAAEDRRRQQDQDAREKAERQAIEAYWDSLTPEQQAELDAASIAQAAPETLELERSPMKRFGQTLRRHEYIRQRLAHPEHVAAEIVRPASPTSTRRDP